MAFQASSSSAGYFQRPFLGQQNINLMALKSSLLFGYVNNRAGPDMSIRPSYKGFGVSTKVKITLQDVQIATYDIPLSHDVTL
jgi:hypothetical protein